MSSETRNTEVKKVESSTLLEAIDCLTIAIGVYGERFDKEISLHWGNGVVLLMNRVMLAGGGSNCARAISEFESNIGIRDTEQDVITSEHQL